METNQYFPGQSIIDLFGNAAEEILTTGTRIISDEVIRQRLEAPSPSPAPDPVVVDEPLTSDHNGRNLWNENNELKKKIIELEKKVDLLMEWKRNVENPRWGMER